MWRNIRTLSFDEAKSELDLCKTAVLLVLAYECFSQRDNAAVLIHYPRRIADLDRVMRSMQ